jgi:hypothetical protein
VLFVEGYFHRSLLAAHEALGSPPPRGEAWVDPAAALGRAVAFGDSLVGAQSFRGHWKTGYRADWWADMGAAAAIFAGLEAHVDTTRARQYERAARRFLGALEREGMLRADGSVAMGRADAAQYGRRVVVREPYLVSTALVGIEVRAWLARRTGDAALRKQALAALEWTLSRLQPDGALKDPRSGEGALRLAAYTQEGWMAADLLLDEPGLAVRLRAALRSHVDWLLSVQDPDGTWVPGDVEESARTPPILDFLIWYDQRCESRPEVRDAIRRGAEAYVDPGRWKSIGLFGTGPHDVVRQALAGRTLAALHLGRYVL